jgi:uncharacterized protein YdbL (DUF1318 family)
MKRPLGIVGLFLAIAVFTTGCLPTQTIIVRFEDLKSDFFALESSLQTGDWATFDWNTMTITISSTVTPVSPRPVALGAFEISQATPVSGTVSPRTSLASAADQPDIDLKSIETTDTIVQIMRRRQARFVTIQNLKKTGVLGEGNTGMLSSHRDTDFAGLDSDTRKIINDENSDRRALFAEVLRQRQLGVDKMHRVAQTFAQVQRDMAPRGVWVQYDDGAWEQIR